MKRQGPVRDQSSLYEICCGIFIKEFLDMSKKMTYQTALVGWTPSDLVQYPVITFIGGRHGNVIPWPIKNGRGDNQHSLSACAVHGHGQRQIRYGKCSNKNMIHVYS
jgi:hypothetical protein